MQISNFLFQHLLLILCVQVSQVKHDTELITLVYALYAISHTHNWYKSSALKHSFLIVNVALLRTILY